FVNAKFCISVGITSARENGPIVVQHFTETGICVKVFIVQFKMGAIGLVYIFLRKFKIGSIKSTVNFQQSLPYFLPENRFSRNCFKRFYPFISILENGVVRREIYV